MKETKPNKEESPKSKKKLKVRTNPNGDIITLEGVTKSYATGAPALNGVDLHFILLLHLELEVLHIFHILNNH